jgi:pimeloyl-ACP methyl ester carboxylesterase
LSRADQDPTGVSAGAAALPQADLPSEPWRTRILTTVGTAVDSTVLAAMQLVVERALIPDPENVGALRDSAQAVLSPELQAQPRDFFAFLDEPPTTLRMASRYRRRLDDGSVVARRIESDYVPYSADLARSDGPILVDHWMHRSGRPPATVLALHGFSMGNPRLDAVVMLARHWYRRGLDVALLTLPHHGARTSRDARFSGEQFAVPHVTRLAEAVREAVYEIRHVAHWLREERGAPAGLIGLSLGGYLAALCAGLYDELDFAVPMVPPACMGELAWSFFSRTRHHREGGEAALSRDELRSAFRIHSPLTYPLRLPRERVMIVAGRGDRIVPPEHPVALWEHWGRPRIHWFSGSHLAPFGRGRVASAILRHLRSIGIG